MKASFPAGTTLNVDNMIAQLKKKKDDVQVSTSGGKVTAGNCYDCNRSLS